MLFSRVADIDDHSINITTLTEYSMKRVSEYKYLDIWLDHKLQFKSHIDSVTNKLRQKLGFLYRNKTNFLMFNRKLNVLDYGDVVYRNASASTLAPLNSVYHSALRFITGDSYSTHHCILYEKVGWAPLTVRRDRHWFIFIYRALIGKMPSYITSLLNTSHNHYSTCSSNWLMLRVPWTLHLVKLPLVSLLHSHGTLYNKR